jgi:hypothetical protein
MMMPYQLTRFFRDSFQCLVVQSVHYFRFIKVSDY